MKVKYLGHSCLEIQVDDYKILVDPFISLNPLAKHIDVDSIEADFILLTHAHYDHIIDFESIAKRTKALLIANHEIVTYYEKSDIKGHAMNPGGSFEFPFGKLKMVHADHSSSFPDGTYGGNPVGFILQDKNGKTIYIAGDTALTLEMQLIPLFFSLDLAILPIGGNFTMDVQEALIASDFVKCNRIMGVHFDSIPLIAINHESAIEHFKHSNKTLILPDIGDVIDI